MKTFLSTAPWIVFAGFAVIAAALSWQETTLSFEHHGAGKAAAFTAFFAFLAYTVYCSVRENFYGSVRKMARLHWGRQVGLDLYIGLILHAGFLWQTGVEGWTLLFWVIPFLVFGNVATLLYLALHFDAVASVFAR